MEDRARRGLPYYTDRRGIHPMHLYRGRPACRNVREDHVFVSGGLDSIEVRDERHEQGNLYPPMDTAAYNDDAPNTGRISVLLRLGARDEDTTNLGLRKRRLGGDFHAEEARGWKRQMRDDNYHFNGQIRDGAFYQNATMRDNDYHRNSQTHGNYNYREDYPRNDFQLNDQLRDGDRLSTLPPDFQVTRVGTSVARNEYMSRVRGHEVQYGASSRWKDGIARGTGQDREIFGTPARLRSGEQLQRNVSKFGKPLEFQDVFKEFPYGFAVLPPQIWEKVPPATSPLEFNFESPEQQFTVLRGGRVAAVRA